MGHIMQRGKCKSSMQGLSVSFEDQEFRPWRAMSGVGAQDNTDRV